MENARYAKSLPPRVEKIKFVCCGGGTEQKALIDYIFLHAYRSRKSRFDHIYF